MSTSAIESLDTRINNVLAPNKGILGNQWQSVGREGDLARKVGERRGGLGLGVSQFDI